MNTDYYFQKMQMAEQWTQRTEHRELKHRVTDVGWRDILTFGRTTTKHG